MTGLESVTRALPLFQLAPANPFSVLSLPLSASLTADMIEVHGDIWIGMSALASGSQFVWTDSSSVDFVNWASNQKDKTSFQVIFCSLSQDLSLFGSGTDIQ